MARAVFTPAAFVSAEGEIAAGRYGHVLRPRQPVTVKGVSETYSGVYLVHSNDGRHASQSHRVVLVK